MESFDAELAALVITAAYALAFGLVVWAFRTSGEGRERMFWLLVAAAVLALGLNKQLDLQTQFTAMMRQVAREGGWFDARREMQALFIRWLTVALALGGLGLAWLTRGLGGPVRVALAGVLLLGGFVALRAASFHHVDALLRTSLLGTRAWVVIELGGILIMVLGAMWAIARQRRGVKPSQARS